MRRKDREVIEMEEIQQIFDEQGVQNRDHG